MISLLLAMSLMTAPAPAETNLCADPRNCRYVEQVEIRSGRETQTYPVGSDLPFVTPEGLQLFPGESVVVSLSADGHLTVESHGRAEDIVTPQKLNQAIAEMNDYLAQAGGEVAPGYVDPVLNERPQNRLRISMLQPQGSDETVLLIENGYRDQIDYRAFMPGSDQAQPEYTTTCELLPNFMAFEHWPHPILVLLLRDFRVVPNNSEAICD